jgi:hypothetical protein
MNINKIIQEAKLGSARRDAQVDTCAPFAAALYDVLSAQGIACQMAVAMKDNPCTWTHSIVMVAGRYYDSMGEFSTDIYRVRAKIHPKVKIDIFYRADSRHDCYESEFDDMYAFYVQALNKALFKQTTMLVAA